MDRNNKIVFWAQKSGLANRLRALIGYQALAKFKKVPFFLCWEPDSNCDVRFSQLFQTDNLNLISEAKLQSEINKANTRIYSECCWFHEIWAKNLKDSVLWESFKSEALRCADQLNPLSCITDPIEDFNSQYPLSNLHGFHIRMTDNLKAYRGWLTHPTFRSEHISSLEGFEKKIAELLEEKVSETIFLATDNRKVEKYFKMRFPGRILTYKKNWRRPARWSLSFWSEPKHFRIKQRTSNIEDALVEMYLLSKCKYITGTYFSSFSKFAAVLGKKPHFEILGNNYTKNEFICELFKKDPQSHQNGSNRNTL